MAWNHDIANEFKKRNNPKSYAYFVGEVISPEKVAGPDGEPIYIGPIIINCFDGQVVLKKDRLKQLEIAGQVYKGMKVALLGDPFGNTAGGQMILVLGEIIDIMEGS